MPWWKWNAVRYEALLISALLAVTIALLSDDLMMRKKAVRELKEQMEEIRQEVNELQTDQRYQ